MRKILMFFVAVALVFGFAGVTGATQFTLSDIDNLSSNISVDLNALENDPVWNPNWKPNPPQFSGSNWSWRGRGNGRGNGPGNGPGHRRRHDPAPVPEPATMLLFGCGLIGLAVVGRKKFNREI